VIHSGLRVSLHVFEDIVEGGHEKGRSTQACASQSCSVEVEDVREALDCGVRLAIQIEAMVYRVRVEEAGDASKAKDCKVRLEGVGLQDGAH
jgi:hypothetical protein